MFKNLLQFWNGKDFLNQVLEDFKNMLDDAERMFISMSKKLIYNEKQNDLENKIYSIDKRINELERDIRKRIIQHLTIQPSVDVSTCLLLMSVVKDAERIGDYSKNLFGVSKIMQRPMNITTYKELFDDMDKDILVLFQETKDAFMQSDEKKATLAWKYEKKITSSCDKIVGMLAVGNLSVNEAVCFTLIARYFKRIAAHLTNIATSVILPLTDLDYFDENRKDTGKII